MNLHCLECLIVKMHNKKVTMHAYNIFALGLHICVNALHWIGPLKAPYVILNVSAKHRLCRSSAALMTSHHYCRAPPVQDSTVLLHHA